MPVKEGCAGALYFASMDGSTIRKLGDIAEVKLVEPPAEPIIDIDDPRKLTDGMHFSAKLDFKNQKRRALKPMSKLLGISVTELIFPKKRKRSRRRREKRLAKLLSFKLPKKEVC